MSTEWIGCPQHYCSSYGEMAGTSMAAPVVAGIAALVFDSAPSKNAGQVGDCLTTTAGTEGVGSTLPPAGQPAGSFADPPTSYNGSPIPIVNAGAAVACALGVSISFDPIPEQTSTSGDTVSLQPHATDSSGHGLSYSATNLPNGLSIDAGSGLISGTISGYGVYQTRVTARSSLGLSRTMRFSWVVNSSGDDPPPVDTESLVGTVDVPYSYYPPIQDTRDAEMLNWALIDGDLPPGITFGRTSCGTGCQYWEFSGTPTTAGSWPLTMFVGDDQGSKIVTITLRISAQPTITPYVKTDQNDRLKRYRFVSSLGSDYASSITRIDTQTGERVNVLATAGVPDKCKGSYPHYAVYHASSADGNQVGIGCSSNGYSYSDPWSSLYMVDLEDGATQRIDVPNVDAVQPVAYPDHGASSSTYIAHDGISDDGTKVLFISGQELTADAANENNTVDHLYLRDLTTGQTALIPTPSTGSQAVVDREARLSRDGNYVDELFEYCSGLNGGYCGGVSVVVHRSPFASGTGPCTPKCSTGAYDFLGFYGNYLGISDDGLTVTYTDETTSYVPRSFVWNAPADAKGILSDADGAILSGDGKQVFYSDQRTLFTCRLVRRSVDASAQFGPVVTLADPPEGLPRTGCSRPSASNFDGSQFVFNSTSTNLTPNPVFDRPDNPTDYYAYYRGTG